METSLAPVCLFVYKRRAETELTIAALKGNYLANATDLIVFSDAAKTSKDAAAVAEVRLVLESITGFKSIRLIYRDKNFGLANSIISGVTEVMKSSGRAIVLEDDIVTAPNFLDFMNAALTFYKQHSRVFAVSAYSYPLSSTRNLQTDVSFSLRSYSWGWASWTDRWNLVDWSMGDYQDFASARSNKRCFNRGGSDLSSMLSKQMTGQVDSWMIRWVYTQHRHAMYDVFPTVSKVRNIGFTETATHTRGTGQRYKTDLDSGSKRVFVFDTNPRVNASVQRELEWTHSYVRRAWFKLTDAVVRSVNIARESR